MLKMRTSGIYGLIVKSTGEIYIGQSTDIAKRWSHYSAKLKANEHKYEQIQDAYDNDDLGWVILEDVADDEQLTEREDWWIKNAPKMDYIVINKEKFGKSKSKVKDVSKMKAAQTGESNGHNTKLSVEDVIEIKKALKKGVRNSVLAKKYKCSTTLIYNIKNGNRWASVEV